jgi:hypothetical protein
MLERIAISRGSSVIGDRKVGDRRDERAEHGEINPDLPEERRIAASPHRRITTGSIETHRG